MESSLVSRSSSRWPAVALMSFAAYGCCSLLYASSSYFLTGVMVGQAFIYFAVAVALAMRSSWAGWFAVGIAISGLVVDAVFLVGYQLEAGMLLDTAAQAALVWLALRARPHVARYDSLDRLTGTAAAPIGWTFALAAGVLPPAVMGTLMPSWGDGCHHLSGFWPGTDNLPAMTLLAVTGLCLIARLRTLGLVPLIVGVVFASSAMTQLASQSWTIETFDGYTIANPGPYMAIVACVFAIAAFVPMGPRFVRALFLKKAR
jgi:hypothetical protein